MEYAVFITVTGREVEPAVLFKVYLHGRLPERRSFPLEWRSDFETVGSF
jgi:hypothetical protein